MNLRFRRRSGDEAYAISQSAGRTCDIDKGEMIGLMGYRNRQGETELCDIVEGEIYDLCDPQLQYHNRRGEELSKSAKGDRTLLW